MSATLLADLDGLLKRHYSGDFVAAQQNFEADFISELPKAPDKPGGESGAVYFGVNLQRSQSGGAQNEDEQFRQNQTAIRKQSTIAAKKNIWAIQLTGFAITMSKAQVDAFVAGLESEFEDKLSAMKKDMNRQFFNDGTGNLALVNGAVTANATVTVDTPGVQYLFPGMVLDLFNSAGTVKQAASVVINSIDETNSTITLNQVVTVADNGLIVRNNIKDSAPTDGKEVMGLKGIADDGTLFTTFQGLSRSTYDIWKGTAIDASGATITNDLLQRSIDKGERRSGRTVTDLFSHRNQRRGYLNVVTPLKRFQNENMNAGMKDNEGKGLEWNGMMWNVSHDCQRDTVYMIPKKDVQRFEALATKLDDTEGSTIHRIGRTDTFEAYYKNYSNVGTKYPASVIKLSGLATYSE